MRTQFRFVYDPEIDPRRAAAARVPPVFPFNLVTAPGVVPGSIEMTSMADPTPTKVMVATKVQGDSAAGMRTEVDVGSVFRVNADGTLELISGSVTPMKNTTGVGVAGATTGGIVG